jgi:hypothetical protein
MSISTMKALRAIRAQFFKTSTRLLSDTLVHLGLGQAGDLLGTVLDLAVGSLESAQNTGALLHVVVASQLVVRNAVQSAVA